MRFIDRYFWLLCILAALLGLFVPQLGMPIAGGLKFLLGSILFFTGLRLHFRAAWRELRRPWLVLYAGALMLIVLPLGVYGLAWLMLPPALATGVLIVAAMPCGTACSPLTDIVRGNAALALVGTLVTSLACPLVTPWVIELGSGQAAAGGWTFLAEQALFLAAILFLPLGAAFALRRLLPAFTAQHRDAFKVCSMLALFLLILGAMASVSGDFMHLIRHSPPQAARLFLFMCFFSAALHVAGYFLAPWRPLADRAALSVNAAYVNNALAIVFAAEFFKPIPHLGASAVLPAILLEIPMVLMLLPLKAWVAHRRWPRAATPEVPEAAPAEVGEQRRAIKGRP